MATKKLHFETLQLHVGQETPDPATDARAVPIYQTTSYVFRNSEHAADRFGLRDAGNIYGRLTNSTQGVFEDRVAALEGGVAGLAVASGAAAVTYALENITGAGDHIVAADNLYGGSFNLITHTLARRGVSHTIVTVNDLKALDAAIRHETKAVYVETFGNPNSDVTNLEGVAEVAHRHGVPLIVDNTFATPINCRPFEWGCDIVTHSTTKYMDGQATQVGGAIVDSGNFDWTKQAEKFPGLCQPDESYHGLTYTTAFGKGAYSTKLVAQLMRDLGSIPGPQNAFLLNLGLETLHLRMARHCENAQKVAEWLEKNPRVSWVNYAGLPSNKYYALAQKYMPNGTCGVIAFGLKGTREDAIRFMDNLDFISIVTHVADARTCVLHPASHTHRQLSEEQLREAGVAPDLIRLSVGIEDINDILDDLKQALDGLAK